MEKQDHDFSVSLLFFWVKGLVSIDSRFVTTSMPNTILGFIPAGKDNQSIPLKNISAARISSSYEIKPILIGAVAALFGLSMMGESFMASLIVLLIAIGIGGSGIETLLVIQRAGADYYISVPFFEKQKLLILQDSITEALAHDTDKTDLGMYMNKK